MGIMAAARTKPAPAAIRRSVEDTDRLVAERLRHRRRMLGMTQQNLARKVGVSYQQLNKYESGENRISVGKLHQIAGTLGVEIGYFFEPIEVELSVEASAQQHVLVELARNFAQLSSRQREAICMIARAMAEERAASST
jgi:transcriptional regulator with XRE-family HTH domain